MRACRAYTVDYTNYFPGEEHRDRSPVDRLVRWTRRGPNRPVLGSLRWDVVRHGRSRWTTETKLLCRPMTRCPFNMLHLRSTSDSADSDCTVTGTAIESECVFWYFLRWKVCSENGFALPVTVCCFVNRHRVRNGRRPWRRRPDLSLTVTLWTIPFRDFAADFL